MKIVLKKGTAVDVSTLVVLASKDKKSGKPVLPKISKEMAALVEAAQKDAAFSGDRKELVFYRQAQIDGYKNILFVGVGDSAHVDGEALRVAGAMAVNALKSHKVPSAAVWGDSLTKTMRQADAAVQAFTEGVGLTNYDFAELKITHRKVKDDEKKHPKLEILEVIFTAAPSAAMQKAVQRAETLIECQNFARWLGDNPGNLMTPTHLAEQTVKAAKGTKLKVTVWDKKRIEKERMGGLLAVAQGSTEEPRFIIMEYNGAPKGKAPVVFVGKGLTFDTGGISIKPSASMEEMKYDMCGGATVIAAVLALAKLKAKVNVIGLVPSTENMPGPGAFKPGDVYFARNDKSVEVFNTDAEGRLILGEALVYASEQKPAAIFDAATLTGAILIALGNTHTGVFTKDKALLKRVQAAADQTGELIWPMPVTDFHHEDMKGTHADLCNIGPGRMAGSATAAAFLCEFVEAGIPYAHFDIAGTAWNIHSRFPYHPRKSASGIMVRTFVELAESFA